MAPPLLGLVAICWYREEFEYIFRFKSFLLFLSLLFETDEQQGCNMRTVICPDCPGRPIVI